MSGIVLGREFPPETAGQQVGWVGISTKTAEDMPDYTQVDIVTAHVGEAGAAIVGRDFNDGSHPIVHANGFVMASSVSTAFIHSTDYPRGVDTTWLSDGTRYRQTVSANSIVTSGTSWGHELIEEGVQWFDDAGEILPHVRSQFNEIGLSDTAYPYVYFGHAHATAHAAFEPTTSTNPHISPLERLLVDTAMSENTQAELEKARRIAVSFATQIDEDEFMKNSLSVPGTVSAERINQAFADSRRTIRNLELEAVAARKSMILSDASYIPIGNADGRARTWPYMDPLAEDEHKAFGEELTALQKGNVEPAKRELNREIRELRSRRTYASAGARTLALLRAAEDQAHLKLTVPK